MLALPGLAFFCGTSYNRDMQKRRAVSALAAFTLCVAAGSLAFNLFHRHLPSATAEAAGLSVDEPPSTLDGHPSETYYGDFHYATATDMLAALHVQIYPEDRVEAFPDPALGIGSTVRVYRAQPVLIKDGGDDALVRTWASTVRELLTERRVDVADQDIVDPSLDTAIPLSSQAFSVAITRVAEAELTLTKSIDYDVQKQDDPGLEQGSTQVKQAGQTGVLTKVYAVRRENGVEVSRTLIRNEITKQPVAKIILVGTKPKPLYLTSGQYMTYFNEAADIYGVSAISLQKLMMCESGGNIYNTSRDGRYHGLFQFDTQTWANTTYGNRSINDPEAQILAAASLWQWRTSKWPACSRGL